MPVVRQNGSRWSWAVGHMGNVGLKFHCDVRGSFAIAFSMWRKKNNIQLKQIAADLGLSVSTINAWELGKRFPTGRHFELLANYTGVPPCRLFCVMADKCVPAECLLALPKNNDKTPARPAVHYTPSRKSTVASSRTCP